MRLLDILKADRVTGTFFMVGREMEKHPEVVRRVVVEGHAVGGHSFTHGEPGATSPRQLAEEIDRTERLFAQIVGRPSRLFRPPHGKLTPGKLWHLWRAGQGVVLWNVDPKDFACASGIELAARFDGRNLRGGDIVLLHDTVPHSAEVLPTVIAAAREAGLSFLPVTAWTGPVALDCSAEHSR
jgi:peptidoglycan/xylan/chitin deacetylase (PgdA/CDA1 family)